LLVYTHITHSRQCCNLHVTFGLNDRRILVQYPLYPNWSAKGFGKAINPLIARWVKILDTVIRLFCFDELCQLAYMIYITNANAEINILSITANYLLLTIHRRVLQRCQDPLVGWDGVEFGQLILRKSLKMLPPDVTFNG